ncbi:hypothetical protein OV203_19930 [Nannocystis sp. ILAH1]|uniref:hypothetical protein n=1 Tax=Nannocystis sp. ILAH1 TaxID=2996789 RepID=UPI00226E9B3A|nr:hypothetical protein [Nannocystis sp. ILAH1]MCY0989420.1 hypothetical protein [Nannocystis sp. ILAH1]
MREGGSAEQRDPRQHVDCGEVVCDALPPDCPPGTLPGVSDQLCWTGACVPVISCWTVPSCGLCPESFICVNYDSVFGGDRKCLPRPTACDGEVDCECAGDACEGEYDLCVGPGDDADLVCDCPNC